MPQDATKADPQSTGNKLIFPQVIAAIKKVVMMGSSKATPFSEPPQGRGVSPVTLS
jgi:hypothetical protein